MINFHAACKLFINPTTQTNVSTKHPPTHPRMNFSSSIFAECIKTANPTSIYHAHIVDAHSASDVGRAQRQRNKCERALGPAADERAERRGRRAMYCDLSSVRAKLTPPGL